MKCWLTHNKSKLLLLAVVSVSAVVVLSTAAVMQAAVWWESTRLLIRKKGRDFFPLSFYSLTQEERPWQNWKQPCTGTFPPY